MRTLLNIPKFEDAVGADGFYSNECTLIVVEGDSAKAFALIGLSILGKERYGVYPLEGVPLNMRKATTAQKENNEQFNNLKQILGLEEGKVYVDTKSLRYGHLMIMADADHDGSNFKGLIINFLHLLWPSLLKICDFLQEFITPLYRAIHIKEDKQLVFYSTTHFESWKKEVGGNEDHIWHIKYFKGLSSNTPDECLKIFENFRKHVRGFQWKNEKDDKAILKAYGNEKKDIKRRKTWIKKGLSFTRSRDYDEEYIRYKDFVNKELIHYALASIRRSIPSVVDGFKPAQRKIIFSLLKRRLDKKSTIQISQLLGYIVEECTYHHGEENLVETVIRMAQDFMGKNNIALLEDDGLFGSRTKGGVDAGKGRYLRTKLNAIFRYIFPEEDDELLDYLEVDGRSAEPRWFMPILPMVLVNGCKGIAPGCKTSIPPHNPREIIAGIKFWLKKKRVPHSILPWYRCFTGIIKQHDEKGYYSVSGLMELEEEEQSIIISELPIGRWTGPYLDFLKSRKNIFIEKITDKSDTTTIDIRVKLMPGKLDSIKNKLLKKFKMNVIIPRPCMTLFDSEGVIMENASYETVMTNFCYLRLEFYKRRKKNQVKKLKHRKSVLEDQIKFVSSVMNGEFTFINKSEADLVLSLKDNGYNCIPSEGATETHGDSEEHSYDHLLSMPFRSATNEKLKELIDELNQLNEKIEKLEITTPKAMWLKELEELDKILEDLEKECGPKAPDTKEQMNEKIKKRKSCQEAIGQGEIEVHHSPLESVGKKRRLFFYTA